MNGSILANRSAIDRNKTDFYETPVEVTEALLDFLEERGHLVRGCNEIWEPACGRGKMAEVMRGRGYHVVCTDLHDHGYGEPGVDFLKENRGSPWIITNPPFSQATEFVKHALELNRNFAFLVKSQFWHAKYRLELFEEHPPMYVLPLTWRPDFLFGAKSGSPTMECCWVVWKSRVVTRYARYVPLAKPAKK